MMKKIERERETAPQRRGLVKRGERSHFYSLFLLFLLKRSSLLLLSAFFLRPKNKERFPKCIRSTTTRPTKTNDKERKRMLRILFLHLFESLFVWFFVVSRVIRSDEEKAKTLRFTQLKIPDSKFKITCEINLLRHCCAHRGRLQKSTKKKTR